MADWKKNALGAVAGIAVIGTGILSMAGSAVMAQQPKGAAPAAKGGAAAPAQQQSAWVKLCEKAQYQKVGADGKPQMNGDKPVLEDKELCLTHHEQMTATGVTIVSAAIQQLQGVEKLGMMLMVPSAVGLTIPPGMKVFVYTKEEWEKLQKKEAIDESKVAQQSLLFTMCHQNGCTAENEATPQLVEAMKKGAAMVALAIHVTGRPVSFEVPLTGFAATLSGKPVDNEEYKTQRGKLWEQIKTNQLQQLQQVQQQLQNPQAAPGAPGAGGPPAKGPAAAPAKK